MATKYEITYTCNKTFSFDGSKNTERSVNWSDFTASGDTNRRVGKIVSITYIHTHSCGKGQDYSLQGRLLFSDGQWIDSSVVTQRINSDGIVTFTNTWNNFPSKSQFEQLSKIQTVIYNSSAAPDGNLTWGVNSNYPMTIIIEFYEAGTMFYGVNGGWKECEVYYGTDGSWVQVQPHFGADGVWKST